MLDKTTLKLFGKYPREVGNPARTIVRNQKQLENFIINNDGLNDCFVSCYPQSGELDKVSFDLDGKGASSEAKQLYKNLLTQNFSVIPVVTGKKGFHLHIRLTPKKYINTTDTGKKLLLNATLKLLEDAFGTNEKGELNCKTVDSHPFGDIRRLIRIPNTLRPPENRNYCTYLPPDNFLNMTESEIAQHMKSIHSYNFNNGDNLPTLDEFPETKVRSKVYLKDQIAEDTKITAKSRILKNVLRPCLYRHIISANPRHDIRVAVTFDLLNFFTSTQIFNMFHQLNWKDWNPETTKYQIEKCRGFHPYSCKTLIKKGIPRECCVG